MARVHPEESAPKVLGKQEVDLETATHAEAESKEDHGTDIDLLSHKALANFFLDKRFDIKLIRGDYLRQLHLDCRLWPRRQEVEKEENATVSESDLASWRDDESFREKVQIISVSHAWETREHPDPLGHQLEQLVKMNPSQYSWYFIDYMSLYQWYRTENSQEQAFRNCMMTMHVLYSHEHTCTHRIEKLSKNWLESQDAQVLTFFVDKAKGVPANEGSVQTKLLKDLVQNRTEYLRRGWCFAEMRWSKLRATPNTVVVVDKKQPNEAQSAPWAPETFKEELEREDESAEVSQKSDDDNKWFYKFTHRNDMVPVLEAYRKAFVAKALGIKILNFAQFPAKEVRILARALPYYENLTAIKLVESIVNEEGAKQLNDGLKMLSVQQLHFSRNNCMTGAAVSQLVDAMRRPSVKVINLSSNAIREEGTKAVAAALTSASRVQNLFLDSCDLGKGVQLHLAPALAGNKNLLTLDLAFNSLEDDAAESLAQVLPNTVIAVLNLKHNKIGDIGAEALAASMMKLDPRKMKLNLERNQIGDQGAKALGRILEQTFDRVVELNLDGNKFEIGSQGDKALSTALWVNPCLEGLKPERLYKFNITFLGCFSIAFGFALLFPTFFQSVVAVAVFLAAGNGVQSGFDTLLNQTLPFVLTDEESRPADLLPICWVALPDVFLAYVLFPVIIWILHMSWTIVAALLYSLADGSGDPKPSELEGCLGKRLIPTFVAWWVCPVIVASLFIHRVAGLYYYHVMILLWFLFCFMAFLSYLIVMWTTLESVVLKLAGGDIFCIGCGFLCCCLVVGIPIFRKRCHQQLMYWALPNPGTEK